MENSFRAGPLRLSRSTACRPYIIPETPRLRLFTSLDDDKPLLLVVSHGVRIASADHRRYAIERIAREAN